jgi:FMNH2-dependent dimethyl sulfone monooxygenase
VQIAEHAGFDYALSQIRFTAGYGAEYQHEPVSFSHALLAATEKLKVIAAILPGPWDPAVAAKQIATINHLSKGRVAVNIGSGWFRGEFAAIGQPWLEHDAPSTLQWRSPRRERQLRRKSPWPRPKC